MDTMKVGIREAKINLSKLLKRIMQGQEVIITDRGRPIGKIVPISKNDLSMTQRLKWLEDQGLLGPMPKGKGRRLPPILPARGGLAQEFLQEDRNR